MDESFLDLSDKEHLNPDLYELANKIREPIKNELGFTVNIVISNNKLLANLTSDFKKLDKVHKLFPHKI